MANTTSTYYMATAKKLLLEKELGGVDLTNVAIGKDGPDSYVFLVEVPNPTDENAPPQEVFVSMKLTAHKYFASGKLSAYDGFKAVRDYELEQANKTKEKEAKAKAREEAKAAKKGGK